MQPRPITIAVWRNSASVISTARMRTSPRRARSTHMSGIDRHLSKTRIFSAVLFFMVNASAHAQTLDQNLARCESNDVNVAIPACTIAIESGQLPQRALAAVYSNRGSAQMRKQAYDLAIADFDQAIMLDPTNATNIHNRGFAFETTGRLEDAINDYSRAIELSADHAV